MSNKQKKTAKNQLPASQPNIWPAWAVSADMDEVWELQKFLDNPGLPPLSQREPSRGTKKKGINPENNNNNTNKTSDNTTIPADDNLTNQPSGSGVQNNPPPTNNNTNNNNTENSNVNMDTNTLATCQSIGKFHQTIWQLHHRDHVIQK